MVLKDISVNLFKSVSKDEKLLQLIECPSNLMKDVKLQIVEDKYPNDLVNNTLSRICIYELPSTPFNTIIEQGWIEVDIYVNKHKDSIDRRILLIAERLINLLDSTERSKLGKQPVMAGIGINYYNRLPSLSIDRSEWKKYGLIFNYNNIRV